KVLILSEGRDGDESIGRICPGCGVYMQDEDPNRPGYFQERNLAPKESFDAGEDALDEDFDDTWGEIGDEFEEEIVGELDESDADFDSDEWEDDLEDIDDEYSKELDGFAPAGVGYGNITEETIEQSKRVKFSKSQKKIMKRDAERINDEITVCARCHSLRNYGQVKNQKAENLIPDFDFDRLIATRLLKPSGKGDATVVVMVVDCVDFDGSFPKRASASLFKALSEGSKISSKNLPKLVLVATKVDLLPSQISPTRLDRWVRHRARANGVPKLSGVHMVSARKDLGVRNLLALVKDLAGPRGNVWIIGAQNAGKSTLINAFSKKESVKAAKLTEAAIPGTTLGILRIGGILSAKAKMYDTPGLLHPYLMSVRLNRDEQKMIEIRKELQPRSFRIKAGQAIHVGGLVRFDLDSATVETIYVTVWASPSVSLHLGSVENADEIKEKHAGVRLQPPIGEERAAELGRWVRKEIKATGRSWEVNSTDVAVAGLGWFSLGLKGEAGLSLWTFEGVGIAIREPLVLDRAGVLERGGFWLPRGVSDAVGKRSRNEA
ncbi:hypothetical protein M569_05621, partial [Genlisea aurea]